MTKVVYNAAYGGFALSKTAYKWLMNHYNLSCDPEELPRHDHRLVECVESLGVEANNDYSVLLVKEIKGNTYIITDYDGWETVVEPKDINWIIVNETGD